MPDYAGFPRIGKMMSVLVSVADSLALKPLLHSQFGLEARVGIELFALTSHYSVTAKLTRLCSMLLALPDFDYHSSCVSN